MIRKAILAIIENEKGEILIGKSRKRHHYQLPQGGLEKGEEEIDALKREMMEELLLEISNEEIIREFDEKVSYERPHAKDGEHLYQEMRVYHIRLLPEKIPTINQIEDEFDEILWVEMERALELMQNSHRFPAYKRALSFISKFQD